MTLADAITFTGGANTLIFTNATSGLTGDIAVNGGGSLTFDQSGVDTTVDSNITGDGSIIKAGTATIILDGVNTYTGGTTVNDGILQAGVAGAFVDNTAYTVNGGTLDLNGFDLAMSSLAGNGGTVALGGANLLVGQAGSTTFSGVISDTGAGGLIKVGAGTLTLTGTGSSVGGDLIVDDQGTLHLDGGSLTVGGTVGVGPDATLLVSGGGDLTSLDPVLGFDIFGSMVVDGPGSTVTSTGMTEIVSLFGPASLTISNGAVFNSLGGANVDGTATDRATVDVLGAGSTWNVDQGLFIGCVCGFATVSVADGGVINSTGDTIIAQDSILNLGLGGLAGRIVTDEIENDGAIVANFTDISTLAADINGTGTLTKNGNGRLILTGTNTYTGVTTINEGTLQIGNGGATGSIAGNVINNSTLAINRAGVLTLGGGISGTGNLTHIGPGRTVLSGNNAYTGGTTVLGGILQAGAAGAFVDDTAYTVNGGTLDLNGFDLTMSSLSGTSGTVALGTADLTVDQAADTTFSGIIAGTGTLTKDGVGNLILTGNSTFSGATSVNGGILSVNGSIANSVVSVNDGGTLGGTGTVGETVLNSGGTLAPGNSVGTITVENSLGFGGGSTYGVEVGGSTADRTNVVAGSTGAGTAVLTGGTVNVTFPTTGNLLPRYTILSAAGGLGGTTFAGLVDNALLIDIELVHEGNNVLLVSRISPDDISGLTINQRNVAITLTDFFDRNGTLPLAFATLDANGLTIASGEIGTAAIQSGFVASDRFMDIISDRFVYADGAAGGSAAPADRLCRGKRRRQRRGGRLWRAHGKALG